MSLDKSPLMNMNNFPPDVWELHRKLFHRFLKYKKYFIKATKKLPEYQKAMLTDTEVKPEIPTLPDGTTTTTTTTTANPVHIINLLETSEEEVSEESEETEETEEEEEKEEEKEKEEDETRADV